MRPSVAVIGGGPAGLMAAEVLSGSGAAVSVYERMPTLGRKLLMAGRGGLNLTHSESFDTFVTRYGAAAARLRPILEAFPPSALVDWAEGLGQPTFVGSSGRVFPRTLKASPLLRAWIARLEASGVQLLTRRRWSGWDGEALVLEREGGAPQRVQPAATVLALGGASWAKLGSDGAWAGVLSARGAEVATFRPANSGFDVAWSELFRARFAGAPLKNVALGFRGAEARGDLMITRYGLEGGAVYALAAALRDALERDDEAMLSVDLRPDLDASALGGRLRARRGGESSANLLRRAGLSPVAANLLRESLGRILPEDPVALARAIKAAPVRLNRVQPLDRAISTAGGLSFSSVDEDLMLRTAPGVFVAGEMLDWEAPTGGYLLQACFASGVAAARGVLRRL